MKENLFEIIKEFSKEKGLDHEIVLKLVEESLVQAAQRKLPYKEIEGQIDPKTGRIILSHFKEVVSVVEDPNNEISVEDVEIIDPEAGLGDEVEYEISEREFQRIAHSTRPIIFGSLKEAERQMVVSTFTEKIGEVLTGTVLRVEPNGRISFSFQNRVEAYLFKREQIYGENFTFGDHVRVLLLDVNDNPHKDSQLTISRTHPGLLIKLFEMEVPEIFDGVVKIVNAAREPGRRAKISVYSTDDEVDPVGSCVGMRGNRVQTIVNDLNGEKIDIVRWSEDIDEYTCNALAPAEIDSLEIDEDAKQIDVVVAPNQLSLAIGHKGQNVRLASKLIGYKINIVAIEDDLSIDEQLEKELAKSKDDNESKKIKEIDSELITKEEMETVDANFENTNSDTDIDDSSPESFNSTEKEMVDSVKNIETKDKSKTKNKDNLEIDSETENNEGNKEKDEEKDKIDVKKVKTKGKEEFLNEKLYISLSEIELSVRTVSCLKNVKIQTIGDIVQKNEQEMLNIKNFGEKSLYEIKEMLAEMGLSLGTTLENFDPTKNPYKN